MKPWLADGLVAGAVAAVVSGAPSTGYSVVARRNPLEATLAAGSVLLPRETRRGRLIAAAVPVHVGVSLAWGLVLTRLLPRGAGAGAGAVAGLAIAALDLGVGGRLFPGILELPRGPQFADHALFGATVAAVGSRRRRGRSVP